jgi:hypothetical protein
MIGVSRQGEQAGQTIDRGTSGPAIWHVSSGDTPRGTLSLEDRDFSGEQPGASHANATPET